MFRAALQAVAGDSGPESHPDARRVETLLERIEAYSAGDERRAALADLKELVVTSTHAKTAFGELGLRVLFSLIREEREDAESARGALEVIVAAVSPEEETGAPSPDDPSAPIAQRVAGDDKSVQLCLSVLDEEDFFLRYHALQVLTALMAHANLPALIQRSILASPLGVVRLMDLMTEREVIRNQTLLLLNGLARGQEEIQKILAFEGAFERAFNIIHEEGGLAGGIIVQDCLELLNNLLRGCAANQLLFREGGFLTTLLRVLAERGARPSAPQPRQASANTLCALETIMLLADADADDAQRSASAAANVAALLKAKALDALLALSVGGASSKLAAVRSLALRCAAGLVRGRPEAQLALERAVVRRPPPAGAAGGAPNPFPGLPPITSVAVAAGGDATGDDDDESLWVEESALSVLLECALRSAEEAEGAAAEEVLASYFESNLDGQSFMVSTIASMGGGYADAESTRSFGSMLARALVGFSSSGPSEGDLEAACRAAALFQHLLSGNAHAKERLLHTPLEAPAATGLPAELLMPRCGRLITSARGPAAAALQAALLRLLLYWLHECPAAVAAFLSAPTHLPALTLLVSGGEDPHVRGLAAALLGVCVLCAPAPGTFSATGGARGGQAGPSGASAAAGAAAGVVLDAILNRVGVERFFAEWEAMTRSPEFRAHLSKQGLRKPLVTRRTAEAMLDGKQPLAGAPRQQGAAAVFDHAFAAFLLKLLADARAGFLAEFARPGWAAAAAAGGGAGGAGRRVDPASADTAQLRAMLDQADSEAGLLRARLAEFMAHLEGSGAGPDASAALLAQQHSHEQKQQRGGAEAEAEAARLRAEVEHLRSELAEARETLARSEESMQGLSQAYNSLEADVFRREEEERVLRLRIEELTRAGGGAPAAAAPAGATKAELEAARREGEEAGRREAQEAGEQELNDLLVCLGQEEAKVEKLREALEGLGVDPEPLIAEVMGAAGEEGEGGEDNGEGLL